MTAILAFLFSPIGRWIAVGGISILVVGSAYTKGRFDGRSAYKAKIERQIKDAISKGDHGSADALRKFDAGELSNDWFRD